MRLSDEVELIGLKGANAYLIHGKKNVLIDTGLPFCKAGLITAIQSVLGENAHIDSILLTHHDVDHVGNIVAVQKTFGGMAYLSSLDMPYVCGQKERPGIKHLIEKIVKPEITHDILSISQFEDENIRILPAPGHTPGHTIFQYKDYIFTGDLFKNLDGNLFCMKKRMNCDNFKMAESINMLLNISAEWLCPGHGNCARFDSTIKEELKKVGDMYVRN